MSELFGILQDRLNRALHTVLVCVMQSEGSVPAKAGALMLMGEQGLLWGTVGGGALEHRAQALAQKMQRTNAAQLHTFHLGQEDAQNLGMVCGGSATMCFVPLSPAKSLRRLVDSACALVAEDVPFWLCVCAGHEGTAQDAVHTQSGSAVHMALYTEGAHTCAAHVTLPHEAPHKDAFPLYEKLSPALFCDVPTYMQVENLHFTAIPIVPKGRVIIFGGGHLTQALVPFLSSVGFHCVVFEDREDFARAELFPHAKRVILGNFTNIAASISVKPHDYVVVLTRGHSFDFEVQNQLLRLPTAYFGVVGSRTKTQNVNSRLLEEGIPQTTLDGVFAPIGLSIGAKSPAEIAVSITAQLIAHRSGK